MIKVKICGLDRPAAVAAAVAGGASYLGFVFFAASPRSLPPERAAHLARPARGKAAIVAVTADANDDILVRLRDILAPDYVQLHGAESPFRCEEVRKLCAAGIIKAIPVAQPSDIAAAGQFEAVADHLMFDARPGADVGRPGGSGASFDWSILAGRAFERPWFLAGGLDPGNVVQAVRLSGAPMADVSTGVERAPGLKDPALVRAFLEAARRA
jgi:phosphoribosylanthranilate isomerase